MTEGDKYVFKKFSLSEHHITPKVTPKYFKIIHIKLAFFTWNAWVLNKNIQYLCKLLNLEVLLYYQTPIFPNHAHHKAFQSPQNSNRAKNA